jgi:hypothetical protein
MDGTTRSHRHDPESDSGGVVSQPTLETRQNQCIEEAEAAFRYGMDSFPTAGVCFVAAAEFFRRYSQYTHQEVDSLSKLKALNPAVDHVFVVFVRSMELDGTSEDGSFNPIDRVLLEQTAAEARKMRVQVLREQSALWTALSEKEPEMWTVLEAGSRLVASIRTLDQQYSSMLRFNPDSPSILRAYAGFLAEHGGNATRAAEMTSRADRIEESASHKRRHVVRHVVLFAPSKELASFTKGGAAKTLRQAMSDESAAVITVSMASASRSEIVGVSPAACRLLLASRPSSLIGQSLSRAIIPQPFTLVHDTWMTSFGASIGAASKVVGFSRTLPVLRQDMTFEPMVVTIDEAPPDPVTLAPRMAAVFSPIPTEESFILFAGVSDGFRIHAVSRKSAEFLHVEPSTLADRFVSMLDFFPSIDPSFVPFPARLSGAGQRKLLKAQPSLARNMRDAASHPASPEDDHSRDRPHSPPSVTVTHMLDLQSTGLIPVEERHFSRPAVVAGSVQHIQMHGMSVFMLRWASLEASLASKVPRDGSETIILGVEDLLDAAAPEGGKGLAAWLQAFDVPATGEKTITMARQESRHRFHQDSGSEDDEEDGGGSSGESAEAIPDDEEEDGGGFSANNDDKEDGRRRPKGKRQSGGPEMDDVLGIVLAPPSDRVGPAERSDGPEVDVTSQFPGRHSDSKEAIVRFDSPSLVSLTKAAGGHSVSLSQKPSDQDFHTPKPALKQHNRYTHPSAPSDMAKSKRHVSGAASVSSAGSTTNASLTKSLARKNAGQEAEIVRIRYGLAFTAVAILVAAIVIAVWVPYSTFRLKMVVTGLDKAADRMAGMHRSLTAIHELQRYYSLNGMVLRNVSLDENFALLSNARNMMHDAQKAIHSGGVDMGVLGFAWDQTATTIFAEPPRVIGNTIIRRNWTFAEAESLYFGWFRTLSQQSFWDTNTAEALQLVQSILYNEPDFHYLLETSLAWRHSDLFELGPTTTTQMAWGGAVFLAVVIVTTTILFSCAIQSLANKQRRVMSLFLLVPVEAARSVKALSTAQLDRAVAEEEEHSNEDDGPKEGGGGGAGDGPDDAELQRLTMEEEDMSDAWMEVLRKIRNRSMKRYAVSPDDAAGLDRPHDDASPFVRRSLLWLMLPIILIGSWLATVVFVSMDVFNRATAQATRIIRVTTATSALTDIHVAATTVLLSGNESTVHLGPASLLEGLGGLEIRGEGLALMAESVTSLSSAMNNVLYGGVACSVVDLCDSLEPLQQSSSPNAYRVILQNACEPNWPWAFTNDCASVEKGVLTDGGLMSGIGRIVVMGTQIERAAPEPLNATASLNNPENFATAFEIGTLQVHGDLGLERTRQYLRNNAIDLYETANGFAIPLTWGFTAVYIVLITSLYWSAVPALSRHLQSSRELARLIPNDLIEAHLPLRARLREVAGAGLPGAARRSPRWKCNCSCFKGDKPAGVSTIAPSPSTHILNSGGSFLQTRPSDASEQPSIVVGRSKALD